MTVSADKKEYLPGEKAKLKIEVKDLKGNPVVGDLLVSVYDRSLEQLAGDTLPPDIREFFWKWRRTYYPASDHTLQRELAPLYVKDTPGMGYLGIFDNLLTQMFGEGGGMGAMGGGAADMFGASPGGPRGSVANGRLEKMSLGAPAALATESRFAADAAGGGSP